MAKKSNKSKELHRKKSKNSIPSSLPLTQASEGTDAAETQALEPELSPVLTLKTWVGAIDTELYERLLKPAFMSFGLRRDDEPLRQLVESIVTSIAMRDAYEGCRKIDDICQRYLYYLESLEGAQKKSWESIELNALTDYWRSQVMLTLIRDSAAIFGLLLPESQAALPKNAQFEQAQFLSGLQAILGAALGGTQVSLPVATVNRDLCDFVHGMSFPWLGFLPESVFPLQHTVSDADQLTSHSFAMASAAQTQVFATALEQALEECMFMDLMAAQHKKIYEDICTMFEPSERLPEEFLMQLKQRIKFDKVYQHAYDAILTDIPLTKDLHRASRLKTEDLNVYGQFASVVRRAAELNLGIYMFHYMG